MTGHDPQDAGRPDYDDAELDELLATATDGMLAKLEAGFDRQAGLADIYARLERAGQPQPAPPAPVTRRREPGPIADNQRLQEVCDRIDTLDACLDALIRAAQSAPLAGGAFVEAARPVLMQLRLGLAGRTLPREQAERILDLVRHNLEQADRILRDQQASSLDQAIRGKLGSPAEFGGPVAGQLRLLGEMIARLYDDAGYAASLVPSR